MHNNTLTTLLITAAAIGLTGISHAQTPAPVRTLRLKHITRNPPV